jgi:putative ABC transport system substrate-binding protein
MSGPFDNLLRLQSLDEGEYGNISAGLRPPHSIFTEPEVPPSLLVTGFRQNPDRDKLSPEPAGKPSMRRREFMAGLGAAAAWPLAARGQQPGRVRLIGMLMPYPEGDANAQARVRTFRQELTRLGWLEGGTVQFDIRWTTDDMDHVRIAAASLVALKPDAIVSAGDRVVAVLMQSTRSVPIVVIASDLAGSGFVETLARPGGNVTGFSIIEFSVIGKMVEVLRQLAPGISRIGMMYNSDNPVGPVYLRSFNAVADRLAVQPIDLPVHGIAEIERAIGRLAELPNRGFIVPPDITLLALATRVAAIAALHNVPAIYSHSLYVKAGGLASYGTDLVDVYRRLASYVDRVLRGEKPGDLPIQQPTKFELVINLKTAKALGLTIPETLLVTADEVIE